MEEWKLRKMDYQNVRGTVDFLPEDEAIRRDIRKTLEDTFQLYGCQPLETPILNYTELLTSKYGGGAEIIEEMYTLTDRGERDLALRYDLTMPFAKVVAMNRSLRMPFKRYEIGKVFRDGPIKMGRFREFTQCDVDIVGVESQIAEAELLMMALDAFEKIGVDVTIQYNNRKLLTGMLAIFGTAEEKINRAVLTIDKLEKVGVQAVIEELKEQHISDTTLTLLKDFLTNKNNVKLDFYSSYAMQNEQVNEGLQELNELTTYLNFLDIQNGCLFNPLLARGLDIYTGSIYEMFLTDGSITSSIGSGGRYDNAIGGLIGTDETFSTVGISFGLDVIFTALQMTEQKKNAFVDYYIIPLGTEKESLFVAKALREKGYRVEVEMGIKRLRRALHRANQENIPKVIIIGEDEVANNTYNIRNMETGEEEVRTFTFQS